MCIRSTLTVLCTQRSRRETELRRSCSDGHHASVALVASLRDAVSVGLSHSEQCGNAVTWPVNCYNWYQL